MALVAAKCPQCGANLNVDETKDACVCEYCGTPFITEKAINNYNVSVTNQNNFDGATINVSKQEQNNDNLMELAELAYKSGKRDEALQYIDKILAVDISYLKAWVYKANFLSSGNEQYLCFLNAAKYAKNETEQKEYKLEYFKRKLPILLDHVEIEPEGTYYHKIPYEKKITGQAREDVATDKDIQDFIIEKALEVKAEKCEEWGDISQQKYLSDKIKEQAIHLNLALQECKDMLPEKRRDEIELVEFYIPSEKEKLIDNFQMAISLISGILSIYVYISYGMEPVGSIFTNAFVGIFVALLLLVLIPLITFTVTFIIAMCICNKIWG